MADDVYVSDEQAEDSGESIHLPAPSYQPVVLAFGVTLAVTGVVLFPVVAVVGLVITIITLYLWIRDTRREISELPLDH